MVADPTEGPALSDLVNAEAGRLIEAIQAPEFEPHSTVADEAVVETLDRYVALTTDLARTMALGGRWSGVLNQPIWPALIERVVAAADRGQGHRTWADLSLYPGVLMLYVAGIGALVGGRYENLRAVLLDPRWRENNEEVRAVERLYAAAVVDDRQARAAGLPTTFAPVSDRLASDLRPLLVDVVPNEPAFHRSFDRFECLLGLVYADATASTWAPTGRFVTDQTGQAVDRVVEAEAMEQGASWPLLKAGAFGGSAGRLEASLARWRAHVDAVRREVRFSRLR